MMQENKPQETLAIQLRKFRIFPTESLSKELKLLIWEK